MAVRVAVMNHAAPHRCHRLRRRRRSVNAYTWIVVQKHFEQVWAIGRIGKSPSAASGTGLFQLSMNVAERNAIGWLTTMRLTPSQIAIRLISGQSMPGGRGPKTLKEKIRRGREMLVQITEKDLGYDLQAWHDHLKESREGGYTYGRNIPLPKIMAEARRSTEWRIAIEELNNP